MSPEHLLFSGFKLKILFSDETDSPSWEFHRSSSKENKRNAGRGSKKEQTGRRFSKPDFFGRKKIKSFRGSSGSSQSRSDARQSRSEISSDKKGRRQDSPSKRKNGSRDSGDRYPRRRRDGTSTSDSSELQQDSLEDCASWAESSKKSRRRNWSSSEGVRRRDSAGESQYSSWSSEEMSAKAKNYREKDSKRSSRKRSESPRRSPNRYRQHIERKSSPVRQPSPTRRYIVGDRQKSPVRNKSPSRRREDSRRRSEIKPGLALTAEQLMDQKQKLRPVRPSALPDISNLPEKSLQDLTVLLQKAMNRRRDAIPPSMASEDPFSDWQ